MSAPLAESDTPRLRAIAASDRPLAPHECAERARLAAALIEPGRLDRSGPGEAVLLWRDEHSEAWLNLWWQPRDTGYHDHTGSCVGAHVIEGRAWNEPLTIGEPPGAREYGPGETFWCTGEGIHRMDHQAGAVTLHVYSPRANVSAGGAGAGALNGLPGRWRRAAARGAFMATIMRLPGPGQRRRPARPAREGWLIT